MVVKLPNYYISFHLNGIATTGLFGWFIEGLEGKIAKNKPAGNMELNQ
jgi:hypothetical protein